MCAVKLDEIYINFFELRKPYSVVSSNVKIDADLSVSYRVWCILFDIPQGYVASNKFHGRISVLKSFLDLP